MAWDIYRLYLQHSVIIKQLGLQFIRFLNKFKSRGVHLVNNWAGFRGHMSCQKQPAAPGLRNIDSYICSKKLGQSELPQTT